MTVAPLTGATVDTAYSATATATLMDVDDGTYTNVWSMTASGGALGLTIDAATGAISGTPTAAGDYAVNLSVTDSLGNTVSSGITLTVTPAAAALAAMPSHYQPVEAINQAEQPKNTKKK
ncbi:Ig domain-containing protein [Buttiauxella sp.]|uniref:Ig domain-containing protein n=1 Tax=Buttiauxella sp. TaxID=1972222 RepID=UPI003C742DAC